MANSAKSVRRATKNAAPARSTAKPALKSVEKSVDKKQNKSQKPKTSSIRKSSLGDAGTLLALCLFMGCLSLAALHAVMVQNQARLDDLQASNQNRQELIDRLLAEIAYLDSPEGVEMNAVEAGLVLAAEVVTLTPVAQDLLPAPSSDPFKLAELPPLVVSEPPNLNDLSAFKTYFTKYSDSEIESSAGLG